MAAKQTTIELRVAGDEDAKRKFEQTTEAVGKLGTKAQESAAAATRALAGLQAASETTASGITRSVTLMGSGLGRIEAGLASAGANTAAFADHLASASSSITALAGDNEKLARSLALTQAATGALSTAFVGLNAALTRTPMGMVLAVASVGIGLWQALTAAVGAFTASTEQSSQQLVSQEAALRRFNDLTGEAARQQANLAAETDRAAEALGRQNVETARATATATGQRLVAVQRDLASAREYLASERQRQGVDDPRLSPEGRARAEQLFNEGAAAQRAGAEITQLSDAEERLTTQLMEQTRALEMAQDALGRFQRRVAELRTTTAAASTGLYLSIPADGPGSLAGPFRALADAAPRAAAGVRGVGDATAEATRIVRDAQSPNERYEETSRRLVENVYPELIRLTGDRTRAQQLLNQALYDANPAVQAARQAEQDAMRAQQRDRDRYQRAYEEPFLQAARSIQRGFADAFATIFETGRISFDFLFSAVRAAGLKLAGEIASLMVFRPIAGAGLQFLGLGNVAQQLGLVQPGGSAGSGGGSGGGGGGGFGMLQNFPLSSLFGGSGTSSWLSGAQAWINDSIGVPLGFGPNSLSPGTYGPFLPGQTWGTT